MHQTAISKIDMMFDDLIPKIHKIKEDIRKLKHNALKKDNETSVTALETRCDMIEQQFF